MRNKSEATIAGAFVLIGLFLFIAFVWIVGSERQIFSTQAEYKANFTDVKGLSEGAPIRLGGITIGRVNLIRFSDNFADPNVQISLLINDEYLERLREDSLVTIETQGLLGDRFVSISTSSGGKLITPGNTLRSKEASDMGEILQKAQEVVDNTVSISREVHEALSSMKGESLTGIGDIFKNLGDITKEIKHGKGFLNSLIYDPKGGEAASSFTGAANNISELASSLSELSNLFKDENSALHKLLNSDSSEDAQNILQSLNKTAKNLEKTSEALANGNGTIGALLLDPSVYDNLVEITDEAKRSILLRSMIRDSLSK